MRCLTPAVALATLLSLSACAGTVLPDNASPRTELTSWCSAYAGLLQTAAGVRDEMGDTAQQTVTGVVEVAGPICSDIDAVANEQSAIQTVADAVERLRNVPAIQEELNR